MRSLPLLLAISFATLCFPEELAPQVNTMAPRTAKPGDTIVLTGVALGPNKVDEVFLTDHKFDMKVKVLEQTDTVIKFRIPPFAKPGRMQLLLLTRAAKEDEDPQLLEQPCYLMIEENSTEIGQVKSEKEKNPPPPEQDQPQPRKQP